MFKGKKAVKKAGAGTEPTSGVVVGQSSHTHKKLWFVLILFVLAGAGFAVWQHNNANKHRVTLQKGAAISGQVELLNDADTQAVASGRVHASSDLDKSYAKALALSKESNNKAAVAEFQKITSAGQAPYYMYEDFALVQARAGDSTAAAKTMQSAITKIKNDSSVPTDEKTTELRLMNNKLAGFQEEATEK